MDGVFKMSNKRAELRRIAKEAEKKEHKKEMIAKSLNMSKAEVEALTEMVRKEAVEQTLIMLMAIPVMIIHDNFGKLMKKKDENGTREERFIDMFLEMYEAYEKGYVSLQDMKDVLVNEGGITIEEFREKI